MPLPSGTYGYYKCSFCFCCMSGCPGHRWNGVRFLGPAVIFQPRRCLTTATRRQTSGSATWKIRSGVYRCHTVLNFTRTCPKKLNLREAIAESESLFGIGLSTSESS